MFDAIWAGIEPLVPVPVEIHPLGCHRPRTSDRDCFEVMLVRLATGCERIANEAIVVYDRVIGLGYLAKRFTHSWPTTSRHLHVLEAAGVVSVRRDGRRCVYRLERDHLRRVIGGWLAQLDPPTSERTWPPSVTKGTTS